MANSEHHEILKSGVTVWNDWRENFPENIADLSGLSLSGMELENINFTNTNLVDTQFSGSKLNNAVFVNANINEADFSEASLSNAIFHFCDIKFSVFSAANLRNTKIAESNFKYATLSAVDLTEATLLFVDFNTSKIDSVDLSYARLDNVAFINVDLSRVHGLDTVRHHGPSSIDHRTLQRSGPLPDVFLRGCGLPDILVDQIPDLYKSTLPFYSCFITHNHTDRKFSRRLHDVLQSKGIRCWLNGKHLLPGDDIYRGFDDGIQPSDKVLLCCSRESLNSWWIDDEINRVCKKEDQLSKESTNNLPILIPLDLDGYVFSDDFKHPRKDELLCHIVTEFKGLTADDDKIDNVLEALVSILGNCPAVPTIENE